MFSSILPKKTNVLACSIVALLAIVLVKTYIWDSDSFVLKCIVSTVDGEKYCVRDRNKLKEAADLLAKVTDKCKQLVEHVKQKYPDDELVQKLAKGFRPEKITETLPTSKHTAFSENKGKKIAFCLNKEKHNNDSLIDEQTLTFVAIHELAHVMTKSIGHKRDFWENFKFLLEEAKESNIYQPVDYKASPQRYCGMDITDNPYYDFK